MPYTGVPNSKVEKYFLPKAFPLHLNETSALSMLFTYLTGNFTSSGVQVYNLIVLSFFQLLSYSVTQHTKFIFSFTHVEWSRSSTTTLHLTNIAVRGKKFKRNHRVCRTGSIYVFLNVSNNFLSLLGCSCRSCNTSS